MSAAPFSITASILFTLAVLHTLSTGRFTRLAGKFRPGSSAERLLHLLGEVEVVFGIWAGLLVAAIAIFSGRVEAIRYVESCDFSEPLFVFVVMTVAATRPVIQIARRLMLGAARLLPMPPARAFVLAVLVVGPLLGSLITEPAAMTVTAILLQKRLFDQGLPERARYGLLATLFVNISIGGVLTPFAAPPVLMVASRWHWGLREMFCLFGWKSLLAVTINAILALIRHRRELDAIDSTPPGSFRPAPRWLRLLHLGFLAAIVTTLHHPTVFVGIFLFFLGVTSITVEYQDELRLKESLLVAFFLAGLVVIGGPQRWWLEPLLRRLSPLPLFLTATGLTAFLDNAALTYLGSLVPDITPSLKYALVAGAVCGGGLTVIANAPNPAGYAILRPSFGPEGIQPLRLFAQALVPTLVAMACLWFLP